MKQWSDILKIERDSGRFLNKFFLIMPIYTRGPTPEEMGVKTTKTERNQTDRGIFSETGKCLIEAPGQQTLEKYRGNPRVEYFPAQITGVVKEHYPIPDADVESMSKGNQLGVLYSLCTLDQLGDHIAKSLSDEHPVGIRGTVCSIDGEIDYDNIRIKDLSQVLNDGTEKEDDQTLISALSKKDPTIHHRTRQWLIQGAQELREKFAATPDLQKKLFPILLVYSLDKLKPLPQLYAAQLPSALEDRARIIVRAYILDYPKSRKELV
jgi:hypothetical protein